jgi:small-conductance mechanosensitive channel
MKWKVNLYVGGKTFFEEVQANSYDDAKRTALARNPTARVIGANPVFDSPKPIFPQPQQPFSSNSSRSSNSNSSSGIDGTGLLALAVVGALIWIGASFWPILVLIGCAWFAIWLLK